MGVLGQFWWFDLLLVHLVGLLLGGLFASLRARRVHLANLDLVHRTCWAEQDHWFEEHEARIATADQERQEAVDLVQTANQERDQLRADLEQAIERMRREMDGARAGYCQAEQALCQQLLAMDRQVVAERTAHRREVQALRVQCDERGELLAAERQSVRVDADQHRQVCTSRDNLRQEVSKLLDLLEQSDTAQAALQHRTNVLEQQMVLGQRQLEDARQALERERAREPVMRPVAQAALTTIASAALAPHSPPPDHLQRRERRIYPALLPPGVPDRRIDARQAQALAA